MHGLIFAEIKKYAEGRFGAAAWGALLKSAGLERRSFFLTEEYPDSEAVALVVAAAKSANRTVPEVLEDFGEFIAPDLIGMYPSLIKPGWRTLELLENTESTMHSIVRAKNPGAHPPRLVCTRKSPDEVVITYASERRLCSLAVGIVRGVARHFREQVIINHGACMMKGAAKCEIAVRRAAAGASFGATAMKL